MPGAISQPSAAKASGGASSGLVLDEKFDSAALTPWVNVTNLTVENGYLRRTDPAQVSSMKYTARQIRNVMWIGEISLFGAPGNPTLDVLFRQTPTAFVEMLCHDVNFHLYKQDGLMTYGPTNGFAQDGRHYYMQAAANGPMLEAHMFSGRHPATRIQGPQTALDTEITNDPLQWTGANPNKQGVLGDIEVRVGANIRLHRFQIFDLDAMDLWPN